MAAKPLEWSKRALSDTDHISDYYVEVASPEVADRANDAIIAATKTLLKNPLAYRMGKRETREFIMRKFPYIIIYRVYPAKLRIVRVLHQARDYFNA